ncbi:MAG: CmcI family methyltransferase [bacterium]
MNKLQLLFKNPMKFLRLILERSHPLGKLKAVKRSEYEARLSKTLAEWIIFHQNEIITKQVTWMGIPIWKNVLDLHIYQEIIFEQSPEMIVEIGSAHGGSTLYLANICDLLGKGTIVSVDLNRDNFMAKHERILALTGNSTNKDIIQKVHELVNGRAALVIQDGDHSKEIVLADLRNYSDLVPLNGYFIIEDTIVDVFNPGNGVGRTIKGPMCAIEEFLAENANFVIDEARERYLLTQNPKGYLKRVR